MPVKSSKIDTKNLVKLLNQLCERLADRPIKVMEVCGTHTVTAHSTGLHSLLPDNLQLISGPGCPVCVTPAGFIDQAARLALEHDVQVMTYGDMVRVPGIKTSLEDVRRQGGKVSVVYSINDAIAVAQQEPNQKIVFLGIGFETTAPATAFALQRAQNEGIKNFIVLCAHKRIIPAMEALLNDPAISIDAFLAPGHVSVIIGAGAYDFIATQHRRPCVVAGFDGEQMLMGLVQILTQLVAGQVKVENVYRSRVTEQGNRQAQKIIDEVFTPSMSIWRGLGAIEQSGLNIRPAFADLDARNIFDLGPPEDFEPSGCRCAEVLKGLIQPSECKLFAQQCTPSAPVGACMVSREGSCSAYYKYHKAGAAS
ncbi:MAG: hypothetical protein AMJ79_14165 [Phycisphaerae bacterium SM23_30]|nr:MAG: hypothetical protein AMJ79_14165 [Phycisphaerae bacterium SM23_30]